MDAKTKANLLRFGMHVAFGCAALALTALGSNIALFDIPPALAPIVVVAITAAASFVRKQEAATGDIPGPNPGA